MNKALWSLVSVLSIVTISPVAAADMPVKASKVSPAIAPIEPPYNWTGFYVGAHAGKGWADIDYSAGSLSAPGSPDNPFNASGFLGGVLAGYNFQYGSWVFGVETDYSFGKMDGSVNFIQSFEIDQVWNLRGRVGYAWDRWMVFATGGWSHATGTSNEGASGNPASDNGHNGYVVGGGLEWGWTKSLRLRAEYLHAGYDEVKYNFINPANHFHRVSFDTDIVRAALIWGF